jgi:cysteine desulfurase / selenocysteine lyase
MSPPSPDRVRALFPAALRACYLNAAASSPICLPVEPAAVQHWRETVEWGDVGWPQWLARRDEIRRQLARYLGATSREVGFLPSTSVGFHVAGWMLKRLGVRRIVTLAQEFPSTTIPLLHQGFSLKVVHPRPDGTYALEDIERALKGAQALAASAVQYASGFRLDLAAVGRLCQRRGAYFALNAAQALGQVPVDVAAHRVDFLCAPSHKWMMGGYGVGLFFARRALIREVGLPWAGWLSVKAPMRMDNFAGGGGLAVRAEASALEAGGPSYAGLFAFGAALDLHARLGIARVEKQIARLQRYLRGRLLERGLRPNAPQGSGICVFPVHLDARRAARALAKKGVVVSPRGGGLRVSTHVFNNEEDVDQLIWAIDKLRLRPAA